MSKWREVKLGKIVTFITGKLNSNAAVEGGEYPFYTCSQTVFKTNTFSFDTECIILGGNNANAKYPLFYKKGKFDAYQRNYIIEPKDKGELNIKFLYYYMRLRLEYMRIASTGVTTKFLTLKILKNIKFQIPDLATQEKIADVLSTYDELIENNNRRIEILEKTAEEIYKEWFVRMRFPGYENTKFIKGIPEGWEVKRVGDLVKVKSGYAFKSKWWIDKGIPVIKIKDIQNNTLELNDFSYVSEENAEKSKQFYVTAGDLLIAMTGATIGKIALVPYYDLMTVNQRVGKFFLGDQPQEKVAFLYFLFLQSNIREQIITIGSSNAAQPNISPFDIEKIKILYNKSVINLFNKKIMPFISLTLKLQKQNQNLIKQRDLLLPRLMNGTIQVK